MFRMSLITALIAAVITPLFVLAATPAHAAEPWVTRAEYRAVKVGMSKARVHRIFDFTGQRVLSAGPYHPYESRHYRTRWDGKSRCIAIDYQRRSGVWRVVGKSQPWRDGPGYGCAI